MIHELLKLDRSLFVVDTETTGVDTNRDRIVELGLQEWRSTGIVKECRWLVNPGVPIPDKVRAIHGISDEDVRLWPTFKQIASHIAGAFVNCDFGGKNVRFDLRLLASEMRRAGVEWSYGTARILDAERLEQLAIPRTLSHLYKKYTGEELEGAHGALNDVRASSIVIVGQLQTHEALPRDLDTLHAAQWPGWIDPDGKFRFVDGVACFGQWGKYANMPMTRADTGYWDWILTNDFPPDVKALARQAKLGKFPTMKESNGDGFRFQSE